MKKTYFKLFTVAVLFAISGTVIAESSDKESPDRDSAVEKGADRAADRDSAASERASRDYETGDTGRAAGEAIEATKDYGDVLKELTKPD